MSVLRFFFNLYSTSMLRKSISGALNHHIKNISSLAISSCEQYTYVKRIGRGSYGEVYVASQPPASGGKATYVAVKFFFTTGKNSIRKTWLREIGLLHKLRHKNIVRLIEVCMDASCKDCLFYSCYQLWPLFLACHRKLNMWWSFAHATCQALSAPEP